MDAREEGDVGQRHSRCWHSPPSSSKAPCRSDPDRDVLSRDSPLYRNGRRLYEPAHRPRPCAPIESWWQSEVSGPMHGAPAR